MRDDWETEDDAAHRLQPYEYQNEYNKFRRDIQDVRNRAQITHPRLSWFTARNRESRSRSLNTSTTSNRAAVDRTGAGVSRAETLRRVPFRQRARPQTNESLSHNGNPASPPEPVPDLNAPEAVASAPQSAPHPKLLRPWSPAKQFPSPSNSTSSAPISHSQRPIGSQQNDTRATDYNKHVDLAYQHGFDNNG